MPETHEVVDFGEPFYSERFHSPPLPPMEPAERLIQLSVSRSRFIVRARGRTNLSSRGQHSPFRGPHLGVGTATDSWAVRYRKADEPLTDLRSTVVFIRRQDDQGRGPRSERCRNRDRIPEGPPRILHWIHYPWDSVRE